jgi:hypothetical protein
MRPAREHLHDVLATNARERRTFAAEERDEVEVPDEGRLHHLGRDGSVEPVSRPR